MTLITKQPQTFPQTHFKYVHVKTTFQTAVNLTIMLHAHCILVKHFKFLWLQLDKEMEQLLAQ